MIRRFCKHFVFCMLLLVSLCVYSQAGNPRPLHVGDTMPDILFQKILNYKKTSARLSEFKAQLLILDLWSVTCGGCITLFPKMDALQKEFGGRVNILLVDPYRLPYDSEEKVKAILAGLKKRTGFSPSLPIPINDTGINTYFQHRSIPHEVWLDSNRKVLAITSAEEVTKENIEMFLSKNGASLPVKNDWAFDRSVPLPVIAQSAKDSFVYRSMFTPYRSGLGFTSGIRNKPGIGTTGYFILNSPLRFIINSAYSEWMNNVSENRVVLKVANRKAYQPEFNTAYCYCYDLTVPPVPPKLFDMNRYLKEDLKRAFHVSVYKDTALITCLSLGTSERTKGLNSKVQKKQEDMDKQSIRKYMHGYTIVEVVRRLDKLSPIPLLIESDDKMPVDIDFPEGIDFVDTKALVSFFKEIGFEVKEAQRKLEIVVISDQ